METAMENATPTPPPDAPAPAAALPEKRPQVEKLLTDILGMLGSPARLEFKDLSDGTLGVALHFAGEVPGAGPKRNLLVESLQFLLNKAINRPNLPRRWVTLGVQGFPEPRQSRPEGEARHEKPAAAPAPAAQGPKAPAVTQPPKSSPAAPAQAQRSGQRPANEKGTPAAGPERAPHRAAPAAAAGRRGGRGEPRGGGGPEPHPPGEVVGRARRQAGPHLRADAAERR